MMEQMLKTGKDLIWLLGCALNQQITDSGRLTAMDLNAVYRLAKEHSVTTMAYYGLEAAVKAGAALLEADPELLKKWKEDRIKSVRRGILMDTERERLLAQLDQLGCWYMPLKGVILKELYPKPDMRYMGDNDILFDRSYRSRVEQMMKENGYSGNSVRGEHHDVYLKPPVYNYEMHVFLFGTEGSRKVYRYFRDVEKKLLKNETGCGRHLSDEDFYLYMMAHGHKHYIKGGNGIRFLVDIAVYLSVKAQTMNWDYIHGEMEKMEILNFSLEQETFAKKLFFGEETPLEEREQKLLLYYLHSGTFGHEDTKLENMLMWHASEDGKVTVWAKLKYLWGRMFPPIEFYEGYMPIAYRYKILIPFAAVYRILLNLVTGFGRILKEIKTALGYKQK